MLRLLSLFGHLFPATAAHAQGAVTVGIEQASNGLLALFVTGSGALLANNLAYFIAMRAWTVVGIIATYNIVRSGIKLINSEEEDKLSKARRTIVTSLIGVMGVYLMPRLVIAVYTGDAMCANTVPLWGTYAGALACQAGVTAGASVLAMEIYGIINWIEVLVAPVAIAVIIWTGLQAIASFGKEEAPEKIRRAVISIAAGLLILTSDVAIKATLGVPNFGTLGSPDTTPVISRILDIVSTLLLMLTLVSVAVVFGVGVSLILSLGEEERATKAKQLLGRVILGTTIIFMSWALVAFVANIF